MQLGVIGLGHVGAALAADLEALGHAVVSYDIRTDDPYPSAALAECRYTFICVNTPMGEDGSADVTAVRASVAELPSTTTPVLRSTVPPGTSSALQREHGRPVLHWPEYVGETTFGSQTWEPLRAGSTFLIVGGDHDEAARFADAMIGMYGPQVRVHLVTSEESELIKYMENCYLALKVSFVNDFYRLCRQMGADWHAVREGWLLDPRVERDHTAVFPSNPGYSGKCLPKDVSALRQFAASQGITLPTVEGTMRANELAQEATNE